MTIEESPAAGDWSEERPPEPEDVIKWFEITAANAGIAQSETLRRILDLNSRTEYLRRYLGDDFEIGDYLDLNHLQSLFASRVPLSSHADIEPLIRRIADGEPSAGLITGENINMLSLSSGTTDGRQKYVPFTRFSSQMTLRIFRVAAAYRSRVYAIKPKGKILEFIYSSKRFETTGGIAVGTATTHWFASDEFKLRQSTTQSFSCSPLEVIAAGDHRQSTYCHLLLGFIFADEVEFVTSTFAYSLVQAFSALEQVWVDLCHDIRTGTLSSARVGSAKVRKAVLGLMTRPDPDRAERMKRKCEDLVNREWAGAIRFLWPNAKYLYSIMTGSMLPYQGKLRHYAGGLPLVCADYGSTESWIGVNLEPSNPPERTVFTVIPSFAYFEFIPLSKAVGDEKDNCEDDDFQEGETVPLSKVNVGQQYEVVLTTFTGLYRYRLGDVVEVSGFYQKTPQLKFICRRKLILTINIDKNTENDLQIVVEKGLNFLACQAKVELVDFTSHADIVKGHYVIYWEINGSASDQILNNCCTEMDLSFADYGYIVSRKTNSIGPLELRIVESGTFKKILEYYIANGAAMSQFKTPRCTKNQSLLEILDYNTVKKFWSTAYC